MAKLITPDGIQYPLAGALVTLGREESDVNIPDAQASRRHAQFARQEAGWVISDLGSTNGTFVNGVRVLGTQPLQSGDRIRIGTSVLAFVDGSLPAATRLIGGTLLPPLPPQAPEAPVFTQPEDFTPAGLPTPGLAQPRPPAQWQTPSLPVSGWQAAPAGYAVRASKQRSTAMLLEIVGGFFGLLGLGWIYADRTGVGIPLLIAGLLANLTFCGIGALTAGISLIVTIPLQIIGIVISALLLNGYTKQRNDLFNP